MKDVSDKIIRLEAVKLAAQTQGANADKKALLKNAQLIAKYIIEGKSEIDSPVAMN